MLTYPVYLGSVNLLASSDSDDGTNRTEQIMQWVVGRKRGGGGTGYGGPR